jgi:hypothetical protein
MKVKLDKETIINGIDSEEELLDSSKIESIYIIRQLKALLALGDSVFEPEKVNGHNQCFLSEFDIWCYYIVVEE